MPFNIGNEQKKNITAFHNPYPNPASTSTTLEFSLREESNIFLFIIDNSGQVLYKKAELYGAGNHSLTLDVSGLSSGLYRIMALSGNDKEVRSFVKIN
jgi:hypothetical protein